jgi:hypothetical protein
MLYVIGGPPRCGKTTLGGLLAAKYGIFFILGLLLAHFLNDHFGIVGNGIIAVFFNGSFLLSLSRDD